MVSRVRGKLAVAMAGNVREFEAVGRMKLGRSASCEIVVNDDRLSRLHAEFDATGSALIVRDLGSVNGIEVNGVPVQEAVVGEQDEVTVRAAGLSVRYVPSSEAEQESQVDSGIANLATIHLAGPPPAARRARPLPDAAPDRSAAPTFEPRKHSGDTVHLTTCAEAARAAGVNRPSDRETATRAARRPWPLSTAMLSVACAVGAFLVAAVLLVPAAAGRTDTADRHRAAVIAAWLADAGRRALAAGRSEQATDSVLRIADVETAMLIEVPSGRVLSPAGAAEPITTVQSLESRPADVTSARQVIVDGRVHAFAPVRDPGGKHVALAWVVVSATESRAPLALLLIAGVSMAAALGWTLSVVGRRNLTARLELFKGRVEDVLAGERKEVADPFGFEAGAALADVVNYALSLALVPGREAGNNSSDPDPRHLPTTASAELTLSPAYVILRASGQWDALMQVHADALVGGHLLRAVTDPGISDGILRGVNAVGESGRHQAVIEQDGRAPIDITVERVTDGGEFLVRCAETRTEGVRS